MIQNLSYWEKTAFFNFDSIIIGCGIVGLNAAIHLKKNRPTLKIAILEAGFLPSGASTKNAGFACFGSVSELIEQEKSLGTNSLHTLIGKRWNGLKRMRSMLGDKAIAYKNQGGFELFSQHDKVRAQICADNILHYNTLVEDITGQKQTFKLKNSKIDDFGFSGMGGLIENVCESSIDTGKMMQSLIALAQECGIFIFNNCLVQKIESTKDRNTLFTNNGVFKAKTVSVCTNAFAKTLLPDLDLIPGRGQVIVTNKIPKLRVKGTFHYDSGFYYFRNIDSRILLGGGRNIDFEAEKTTNFGITDPVIDALITLLKENILPNIPFKIEYKWSGIMAFGSNLNPIIKKAGPSLFCAVRCSGMGVAIGSQTGVDLADLVLEAI